MDVIEFGSKFKILFSSGMFAAHGVWQPEVGVSSLKTGYMISIFNVLTVWSFWAARLAFIMEKRSLTRKIISIIFAS